MYVYSILGAFGTLPEEYILHHPCGLFLTKRIFSEALTICLTAFCLDLRFSCFCSWLPAFLVLFLVSGNIACHQNLHFLKRFDSTAGTKYGFLKHVELISNLCGSHCTVDFAFVIPRQCNITNLLLILRFSKYSRHICSMISEHVASSSCGWKNGLPYLLTYLLTYLLHRAESFLRSQLVLQLIKKFPAFYGTRRFITVLTSPRHLSLS